MPKKSKKVKLNLDERLSESKHQATSMFLPQAVHRKLDLLADLTQDIGASRAHIIGMLISEAELDEASLESRILAYKKKKVRDVIPDRPSASEETHDRGVVVVERRGPGRPRRRAGQP